MVRDGAELRLASSYSVLSALKTVTTSIKGLSVLPFRPPSLTFAHWIMDYKTYTKRIQNVLANSLLQVFSKQTRSFSAKSPQKSKDFIQKILEI